MYSLRASRMQIHRIRMMRTTLLNKREMWLDALAGNSAGCLTVLTVTGVLVLCRRRISFTDNTGSSSLSAAAAAGWLLPVWEVLADTDAGVVVCGGGVGVDAGGKVGGEEDTVTTGLEVDADDGWTLCEEETSEAEVDWTDADGTGWATPAQTSDVGITLLATVDNEGRLVNAGGNIVEGGMNGNLPGPGPYGGIPAPVGGKKGGGIWPKYGIIGGINGIWPAANAGCIGIPPAANSGCIGINGDMHDIGGEAEEEVAAPVIIIWGSNGGGKKRGFG